MSSVVIEAAIALMELAAKVAPHILEAIKSSGELDDAQRAALIARVQAARAVGAAYEPRDV